MRFRKIKWFSQSHVTRKWESWDIISTFWWSSDSVIVLPKSRVADTRHPGADPALSAKLWCSVWTEFHRTSASDKATWWPWKIQTKQKVHCMVRGWKKYVIRKSFLCIRKNIVSFKIGKVFFVCLLTICFSFRETSSFENQIEVQISKQKKSNQIQERRNLI